MDVVAAFFASGLVMGVLDYIWLGTIARGFYFSELNDILRKKPRCVPALLFYALYVIGVVVFVVNPAIEAGSLGQAVGYGALFGMVAYATYDLTNLATLRNFSWKVVIVDLLWGTFLTASMAGAGYKAVAALLIS